MYNFDASLFNRIIEIVDQNRKAVELLNKEITAFSSHLNTTDFSKFSLAYNNYSSISQKYRSTFEQWYDNYNSIFSSINEITSAAEVLKEAYVDSVVYLQLVKQTDFTKELARCFSNVEYAKIPSILNSNLSQSSILASDFTYYKTSNITALFDEEISYPKGFKTSLRSFNKASANDLSHNTEIRYEISHNVFVSESSKLNSSEMNVICSSNRFLNNNSNESFSEQELMGFSDYLSFSPMLGIGHETGRKIYDWINQIWTEGIILDFDFEKYYHCRSRKQDEMPYVWAEMKKAPYGIPSAGRYNLPGQSVFYFSNTQKGAEAEVRKHLKEDEVLQTAILKPKKSIHLIDFSGSNKQDSAFLRFIRFQVKRDNQIPTEYLISNFLANCCKEIGFDGIKYYGTKEYSNYVSWTDEYFDYIGSC